MSILLVQIKSLLLMELLHIFLFFFSSLDSRGDYLPHPHPRQKAHNVAMSKIKPPLFVFFTICPNCYPLYFTETTTVVWFIIKSVIVFLFRYFRVKKTHFVSFPTYSFKWMPWYSLSLSMFFALVSSDVASCTLFSCVLKIHLSPNRSCFLCCCTQKWNLFL